MEILTIPCPTCHTPISFDPSLLIKGSQFTCTKCQSKIGLAQQSLTTASEAMKKFNDLKAKARQS